jgi:hypothetical protein
MVTYKKVITLEGIKIIGSTSTSIPSIQDLMHTLRVGDILLYFEYEDLDSIAQGIYHKNMQLIVTNSDGQIKAAVIGGNHDEEFQRYML